MKINAVLFLMFTVFSQIVNAKVTKSKYLRKKTASDSPPETRKTTTTTAYNREETAFSAHVFDLLKKQGEWSKFLKKKLTILSSLFGHAMAQEDDINFVTTTGQHEDSTNIHDDDTTTPMPTITEENAPEGAQGIQGIQGIQGVKGDTGDGGPIENTGSQGPQDGDAMAQEDDINFMTTIGQHEGSTNIHDDDTTTSMPTITEENAPDIPMNCILWHDGCNNCFVEAGLATRCTKMLCLEKYKGTARCIEFQETTTASSSSTAMIELSTTSADGSHEPIHCEGTFTECQADCSDRVFTIDVEAQHGGNDCAYQDGDTLMCSPGDGACASMEGPFHGFQLLGADQTCSFTSSNDYLLLDVVSTHSPQSCFQIVDADVRCGQGFMYIPSGGACYCMRTNGDNPNCEERGSFGNFYAYLITAS